MIRFGYKSIWLLLLLFVTGCFEVNGQNKVAYFGKQGPGVVNKETLQNAWLVLSSNPVYDSTVVIMGNADNLDWLPGNVPVRVLGNTGNINSSSGSVNSGTNGQNFAFMLHLSRDLETPLALVRFPVNTAHDVGRIRTTTIPNERVDGGLVYISGRRTAPSANDGYYIARLDYNFTSQLPAQVNCTYLVNVDCYETDGDHEIMQPWDVQSDGKVVYAHGQSMAQASTAQAFIRRMTAGGQPDLVPNWFLHYRGATSFHRIQAIPGDQHSAIFMKAGNVRGALRSYNQRLFDTLMTDENNNPGRKSAYPDDYYYDGPSIPGGTNGNNGGYTGYVHDNRTHRIGSIAIDRRNNDMYFGYCVKTNLPSGLGDFEPALVAMDSTGRQKWWRRLYQETPDHSPPDQWVDALEIDYFNNMAVVIARSAGNWPYNFFAGNGLYYNPTAKAFQNGFTGTGGGSALVSWIGKYTLDKGRIMHATYLAEFSAGTGGFGAILQDPNYDGWYDPNSGWISLNTTIINYGRVSVSRGGSVCVTAVGRRPITTRTAHQKMIKPDRALPLDSVSAWSWFARVYTPDLADIRYSSLLSGRWDTRTQQGGNNTRLHIAIPILNGIIVVGQHQNLETSTPSSLASRPNGMPTVNPPSWIGAMGDSAYGQAGILARLSIPPQRIKPLVQGQTYCRRLLNVSPPNWVVGTVPLSLPGDYAYNPNNNFTVQLIDSLGSVISDTVISGTNLRNLAIGIPPWATVSTNYRLTIFASSPSTGGDTVRVSIADGPPGPPPLPYGAASNLCLTGTSVFKTFRVPLASSYRWRLSNNDAGTTSGSDTVCTIFWDPTYNSDNNPVTDTVSVYVTAVNQCGESLASERLFLTLTNACLTVGSGIAGGTYCPLTTVQIPFQAPNNTVFRPGNQFMVQVADADGNFSTPVAGGGDIIGSIMMPMADSTGRLINNARRRIPCFLPFGLAGPTRIRVVSTQPELLGGEVTINVNVLAEPPIQPYFINGYGKITNGRLDINYPSNIAASDNQGTGVNICSFGNQQDRPGGCGSYPATSPFGCGSYRSMIYVTKSVEGALSYRWTLDPPEAGVVQTFAGVDTAAIVTWDTTFAGGPVSLTVTATSECIGLSSLPLIINVNNCAPITSRNGSFNADTSFCAGSTFPVTINLPSYAPPAIAAPRELLIELSDQNGNFTNPIIVGSMNTVTLPPGLPTSTNYRLRVRGGTTDGRGGLHRTRPIFLGNPIRISVYNSLNAPANPLAIAPVGPGTDSVCTMVGTTPSPAFHQFKTAGIAGARSYSWSIVPTGAGTIVGRNDADTIRIAWTQGFIGTAFISVRGVNVCGPGAASNAITINLGYKGAPGSTCGIPQPLGVDLSSYRTKATGSANWSQSFNWEVCPTGNCDVNAPDLTGGWQAALTWPHALNSNRIYVRNTVQVDQNLATSTRYISRLRVEPSGRLEILQNAMSIMGSSIMTLNETFNSVTEGSAPPTGWTVHDADDNNVDMAALCNIPFAGNNDDNPTMTTIQCGGNCPGKSSWFGRQGQMLSASIYANNGAADDWLASPGSNITANQYVYWQGQRYGRNGINIRCAPCATSCGSTIFNNVTYEVRAFTTDPSILSSDPVTLTQNSVLLGTYTESGNNQVSRSLSLAQFAGRRIWIAFRHISNVTGLLSIENVQIGTPTTVDLDIAGTVVNGQSNFNGFAGDITNLNNPVTGIVRSTGTIIHNRDGGALPICTWEAGSTLEMRGITGNMPGNMSRQSFYNLVWNCVGQNRDHELNSGNPVNIRVPALQQGGKLKVVNTNNNTVFITTATGFSPSYSKIEIIDGKLALTNGTSGISPLLVSDSLVIRGGAFYGSNDFRPYRTTVNLAGHLLMTGGLYECSNGNNPQFWIPSFTHQLNISGNFIVEGGEFKSSFTGTIGSNGVTDRIRSQVVFAGNNQQLVKMAGTLQTTNIEFVVNNSGGGIKLLSDITIPVVRRVRWDGINWFPSRSFSHRAGDIDLNGFNLYTPAYTMGSTGFIGRIIGTGTGRIFADTLTLGGIVENLSDRLVVTSGAAGALQGAADSNSYIIGGLERAIMPAINGSHYLFPVGKSGAYKGVQLSGLMTNQQPLSLNVNCLSSGATDLAPDRLRPFINNAHWSLIRSGGGLVRKIGGITIFSDSLNSLSRIGQDTASTTGNDPDAVYTNLGGNLSNGNRRINNEKAVFHWPLNNRGATFLTIAKPGYMPATVTIGRTGTYPNLTEFSLDYNSLELNQDVVASFTADYDGDTTNRDYPERFPIVFKQNTGRFKCTIQNPTGAQLVTAGADTVNAQITFDGVDQLTFDGLAGNGNWTFKNRKTDIRGPIKNFVFMNDATYNTLRGVTIEGRTSIPPFPKVIPLGSCPFNKIFYEIKNLYNPSIAFYVPCPGLSPRPYPYSNNPLPATGLAQAQILGGNKWNSTLPAPDGDGDTSYNGRVLTYNACVNTFNIDPDYRPEPPRGLIKPINPGYTCDCKPNPAFPPCPAGTPNCNYAADYRSQNQQKIDCSPPTTALPPNMRPPCPVAPDTVGMMARWQRQWQRWIQDSTVNAVYVANYARAKRRYDSLDLVIRRALYQLSVDMDEALVHFANSPSGGVDGNSFNTIENCELRGTNTNGPKGELRGYAWGILSLRKDFSGALNTNNRLINNKIYNFRYRGIDVSENGNGPAWSILGNSIFNTNPGGCRFSATATAIRFTPGGQSDQDTISGNYIGGTAPLAGGDPMVIPLGWNLNAIDVNVGGTTNSASFVNDNVIQNVKNYSLGYPEDQSAGARCIQISSGVVNVNNNRIGRMQDTLVLGPMDIIYNNSNAKVTMNGNEIRNVNQVFAGIRYVGTGAVDVNNNIIDNLRDPGNGAIHSGIYVRPVTNGVNIENNTVTRLSYYQGSTAYGIFIDRNVARRPSSGTIRNNTIGQFKLADPGDGNGGWAYGISLAANSSGGNGWLIYNNAISLNNPPYRGTQESNRSRNSSIFGIVVDSVASGKVGVYHNTVLLAGLGRASNYAFLRKGLNTPELRVRNNVFLNSRSGYAIGTNRTFDWAPVQSNYNLLGAIDTNLTSRYGIADKSFNNWIAVSQGDASSLGVTMDRNQSTTQGVLNQYQLFNNPDAADLTIKSSDSSAWFVNTRGVAGPEGGQDYIGDNIKFDRNNSPRASDSPVGYLARWGADLGAFEVRVDSSVLPPASLPSVANPRLLTGSQQVQQFVFGGRTFATLDWSSTTNLLNRPTSVAFRYRPGIDPSASIMQNRYFFARWDVSALGAGGPFAYKMGINYDRNVMARVELTREGSIKIARNHPNTLRWKVYQGNNNISSRYALMSDTAVRFGKFTLTDSIDQIPERRIDTVEICNQLPSRLFKTPRPIYEYRWSYSPQTGVQPFDTLDPNPLVTIFRPDTGSGLYRFVVFGQNPFNQLIKTYDTLMVRVLRTPKPLVGPRNVSICSGVSTTIGLVNDPAPRYKYRWKLSAGIVGDTSQTPTLVTITRPDTVLQTFTAILIKTDTITGCEGRDTVFLSALPNPVVNLGQDTVKFCAGGNAILGNYLGRPGYNYRWLTTTGLSAGNVPRPAVTLTTAGVYNYVLEVTNGTTSCRAYDSIAVVVLGLPPSGAGADRQLCSGDSTVLGNNTVIPGLTYEWSPRTGLNNPFIQNPVLTLTNTGTACQNFTYTLTVREASLNCLATSNVVITVCPKPVADAGQDKTTCSGDAISVGSTAVTGYTYRWRGRGITGPDTALAITNVRITHQGIDTLKVPLVVEVTNGFGCKAVDSVWVNILPQPLADVGPDLRLCSGEAVQIGTPALTGYSYSWSPAFGLSDTADAQPVLRLVTNATTSQQYILTTKNTTTGCSWADTLKVVVRPLPVVNLGTNSVTCANDSLTLGGAAVGNYTYIWTSLSTNLTLSNQSIASPRVVGFNNSVRDSLYQVVLTVLDTTGCQASDTLTVRVHPLPVAVAGADRTICHNLSTRLGRPATTGETYLWSGSQSANLSALNVAEPDYTGLNIGTVNRLDTLVLTVTNTATGCKRSDTVLVTVRPQVRAPQITQRNPTVCPGTQGVVFSLNSPDPGYSYNWSLSSGGVLTSSGNTATVNFGSATGQFKLYVTASANGCTGPTDSITISLTNQLRPVVRTGPVALCISSNVVTTYAADSLPGSRYRWTVIGGQQLNGDSTFRIGVRWQTTGIGKLVVEEVNGACRGRSDTLMVNIFAAPDTNKQIYGLQAACENVNLPWQFRFAHRSGGRIGLRWTVPAGLTYTQQQTADSSFIVITAANAGTYTLTAQEFDTTSAAGLVCPGKVFSRSLTISSRPVAAILPYDSSICQSGILGYTYLARPQPNITYQWMAIGGTIVSATGATVVVNWQPQAGNYLLKLVTVSTAGCSSDTVTASFYADSSLSVIDYVTIAAEGDSLVDLHIRSRAGNPQVPGTGRVERLFNGQWQQVLTFAPGFSGKLVHNLGQKPDSSYQYRIKVTDACGNDVTSAAHRTIHLKGTASTKGASFSWNAYAISQGQPATFDMMRRTSLAPVPTVYETTLLAAMKLMLSNNGPDDFVQRFRLLADSNGRSIRSNEVVLYYENLPLVYNVWTPNQDGNNDALTVEHLNLYPDAELTVFNRYGVEVYKKSGYRNDWTGEGLPAGTYFYSLKAGGKVYTGWVQLMK